MLLLPCSLAPWISNLQIHKLSCQRGCRQVPAWCLSSSTTCVDDVRLTYDLGPAAAALRSKEAAKVRLRAALAPCSDTKFPGFCATPLIHLQYMLALSFRSSYTYKYINECCTSTPLAYVHTPAAAFCCHEVLYCNRLDIFDFFCICFARRRFHAQKFGDLLLGLWLDSTMKYEHSR